MTGDHAGAPFPATGRGLCPAAPSARRAHNTRLPHVRILARIRPRIGGMTGVCPARHSGSRHAGVPGEGGGEVPAPPRNDGRCRGGARDARRARALEGASAATWCSAWPVAAGARPPGLRGRQVAPPTSEEPTDGGEGGALDADTRAALDELFARDAWPLHKLQLALNGDSEYFRTAFQGGSESSGEVALPADAPGGREGVWLCIMHCYQYDAVAEARSRVSSASARGSGIPPVCQWRAYTHAARAAKGGARGDGAKARLRPC